MLPKTMFWLLIAGALMSWECKAEDNEDNDDNQDNQDSEENETELPPEVKEQIRGQKETVQRIMDEVLHGEFKGMTYNKLAVLADRFGHRLTGSKAYNDSLEYFVQQMQNEGFENVHTEDVTAPKWVRGEESAMMTSPRLKKVDILALYYSVGTPPGGIEAEVLVVKSFTELEEKKDQIQDKIVVYDQEWVDFYSFFTLFQYTDFGASRASKYGAKAVLVRSLTDFSIYSVHTMWVTYNDSFNRIPAACITVEDARLMSRMQARGETIRIRLNMGAQNVGNIVVPNIVGEIVGSEKPYEYVIIGGHSDSYDVGQGVQDDGFGCILAMQALSLMKKLGLRPKRTVRAVLWAAEEIGLFGGDEYYNQHKHYKDNVSILMEADYGLFKPLGIGFQGHEVAKAIIQEILYLLKPLNTTTVDGDAFGADLLEWMKNKVPTANLYTDNKEKYWWFHHTDGDTIDAIDSGHLDIATILWTVTSYAIADLDDLLSRPAERQRCSYCPWDT